MDLFTHAQWRQLADVDAFPCISIYMPLHPTGPQTRENVIRCRNLLDDAEEQLRDHGLRTPDAKALLAPARDYLNEGPLFQEQSQGLAMFLAPGIFYHFRVPLRLDEMVIVDHHFHLKPLMPLLEGDGRFYVLAASLKRVRLFEGTNYTIHQVHPESLPEDLINTLQPLPEPVTGNESPTPLSGAGPGEAIFRGQGAMGDSQRMDGEVRNYFERINRGLRQFFRVEREPLVFAGSEKHFAVFKSTCTYRHIVDQPIIGAADSFDARQLHDRAWPLVEPIFRRERDERLERFCNLIGTGTASNRAELVLMAARQGAVDAIFLARGAQVWGKIDESADEIYVHDERQPGDTDLLEHAAHHTLLNGGLVYTLDARDMPTAEPVAALFRYPVTPTLHPNPGWPG